MNENTIRMLLLIVQGVMVGYIAIRALRFTARKPGYTPEAFFAFALASYLVNDLYWIAFNFMYQDLRMPFSVADFSEDGALLLLGSVLLAVFPEKSKRNPPLFIGAMLFSIANMALWICWSGEWLKDILGGCCYAYFAWQTARALWLSGAFSRKDWLWWGIGCAALLGEMFAELFVPAQVKPWMEGAMYVMTLTGMAFLILRTVRANRGGAPVEKGLSLAVAGSFWAISCVYMCAEPAWFVAEIIHAFALYLVQRTLERQVSAA